MIYYLLIIVDRLINQSTELLHQLAHLVSYQSNSTAAQLMLPPSVELYFVVNPTHCPHYSKLLLATEPLLLLISPPRTLPSVHSNTQQQFTLKHYISHIAT